MNTDFRISVSLPGHPKALKLMRRCGDRAFYCLIRFWAFVAQNRPNGDLTGLDIDDIEIAADWTGDATSMYQAMLDLCLIEKVGDKLLVHDWKDHNGYAAHAIDRSEKAKRAAEARWNKLNDATSMPQAMLNDATSNAPSPAPYPAPTPNKLKTDNGHVPFKEIISHLNEAAGKDFKWQTPATQRNIMARWKEGHTLDDFKLVIDHKSLQWAKDPKMSAYLRPETLFGTKFESYLNEIPFEN